MNVNGANVREQWKNGLRFSTKRWYWNGYLWWSWYTYKSIAIMELWFYGLEHTKLGYRWYEYRWSCIGLHDFPEVKVIHSKEFYVICYLLESRSLNKESRTKTILSFSAFVNLETVPICWLHRDECELKLLRAELMKEHERKDTRKTPEWWRDSKQGTQEDTVATIKVKTKPKIISF